MEKLNYNPCDICNKGKDGRCNLSVDLTVPLNWEELAYCPISHRFRQNETIFNSNINSQGYPEPTLFNQNTGEVYPDGL